MLKAGKAQGRTQKRIEWSRRVQAWQRSGRTQSEYCRRRGWPVATFAWWKRRLGAPSGDGSLPGVATGNGNGSHPQGEGFLPVQIVPPILPEGPAWACELGLPDGTCVRLRTVPTPAFVRATLAGR